MKDLFRIIRQAASEINEATVFFSTGKDSIVSLDLCCKFLKNIKVVYLYFVKGLSFRESILNYYSKRYNIKIDQYPQVDLSRYYANRYNTRKNKLYKKQTQADMDAFIRKVNDTPYLVYGYRKDESLERRGMIWHSGGFDKRNKKIYPVADFSAKDIFHYIKKNRLPLPDDYNFGFRDINIFKGEALQFLINNYPDDFERVKKQFPEIEAELLRL